MNKLVVLLIILGGCAVVPVEPPAPLYSRPEPAACLALFDRNDELIARAGVGDAENARIRGFPFLRTNRFLSSLRDRLTTAAAREAWIEHLSRLDVEGRRIELRNLPAAMRPAQGEIAELERCAQILKRQTPADRANFDALRRRAVVPDSYRPWARALGLYPLASLFVLDGVDRLHQTEGRHFARDTDSFYRSEERIAYGSNTRRSGEDAGAIVAEAPRDALGIPRIAQAELARLFERHSPIWSVATRSQDDRIGTVRHDRGRISIDTAVAAVYTHLSYTKFDGEVLLQLNYTVWFPARPKQGALDLLGGAIDGITWRATLDGTGRLLAADAMHNCGCYYMAFPTSRIRPRERPEQFEEPLWVPATLSPDDDRRVIIYVSSTAHYIRKVEIADGPATRSEPVSVAYDELRSLSTGHDEHQSLFDANGLIKGSERGERWFLWPMGIASAGAMRQFGHHAIAFVGRRHFDDPDLLEAYFERTGSDN
jgi:hypothetical protein